MAANSENRYNPFIMIDDKSQDDRTRSEAEAEARQAHEETLRRMRMTTDDKLLEMMSKIWELESRVERLETLLRK